MIARLVAGLLAITLTTALALAQPTDEAEREELRRFLEDTINSAESFEDRFDAEVWLTAVTHREAATDEDDPRPRRAEEPDEQASDAAPEEHEEDEPEQRAVEQRCEEERLPAQGGRDERAEQLERGPAG